MSVRQSKKEYRIIKISDLPTHPGDPLVPGREGEVLTDKELARIYGIHVFDRGATNVQALCNGYEDSVWPGDLICGQVGVYGNKRTEGIKESLLTYKAGVNKGRTRLMIDKRPEETVGSVTGPDAEDIPSVTLNEDDRLKRNLPRIMGDY